MEEKVCKKCGDLKPFDAYHDVQANKDGKSGVCKVCTAAKQKIAYDSEPAEQRREERRIKNADKVEKKKRIEQRITPETHKKLIIIKNLRSKGMNRRALGAARGLQNSIPMSLWGMTGGIIKQIQKAIAEHTRKLNAYNS